MCNITNSSYDMRLIDDLARKDTVIHRIHPLIKVFTTVIYLAVVISFDRYAVGSLLPLLFYPVLIFALAEIPVAPIIKRVLLVEPLIIGIGILNPILDQHIITILGFTISKGWLTFFSIFLKCGFTVTAALLLMATTGMDNLGLALRMLKIPRIFVLQLLLTYRYTSVLMEEVARILSAYSLRAPQQKGIHRTAWGSLAGQLILRTFDRAQRIYQAMCLRGFDGEYRTGANPKVNANDIIYFFAWMIFFGIVKAYNIPMIFGALITGVVK